MNRSSFVNLSAATAAALAFFRTTTLGSATAVGTGYRMMMTPLVATVLPIGARGFPSIESAHLADRIANLYGLDADAAFLGSLAVFSDISTFATGSQTLFGVELATVGNVNIPELLDRDSTAFRGSGLIPSSSFVNLSPSDRRTYLRLWEQSAFNTRRRFYCSVRAVTFSAFYSMPDSWVAIGYAGPLENRVAPQ